MEKFQMDESKQKSIIHAIRGTYGDNRADILVKSFGDVVARDKKDSSDVEYANNLVLKAIRTEDNREKRRLCEQAVRLLNSEQKRIESYLEGAKEELRYAKGGELLDKWLLNKREELLRENEIHEKAMSE